MFSKNLKFYRLRKQMSKKELADKVGLTPMAITHYETGDRKPDMKTLQSLADALEVRISDFLTVRDESISFVHSVIRENASLSKTQQEYIHECVEEYFNRFMTVVEILGGEVLPDVPVCHSIEPSQDPEKDATALRTHLGFAKDGPIENLIGKLENKGILICECDIDNDNFSGVNSFVNNRPFIVINPKMTTERIRSTIVHELALLMFVWPESLDDKEVGELATAIGGAFLFPESDAKRELGLRRTAITQDMVLVAIEYGISMMMLVKRAQINRIVTESVAKDFFARTSETGWRTHEPSRIQRELPSLFGQLVYRAVNEGVINVQRGAELLQVPFDSVSAMLRFSEIPLP